MTHTTFTSSAVAGDLRPIVRGRVLSAGEIGFDELRQVWNGAVDRSPLVIVRCADEHDVSTAVNAARANGVPLSVRGGGHDWAGRAIRDGGLLVDLSAMNRVTVQADTATAEMQGGTRAGELVAAAQRYGLTPVTGTVSAVGVVGLTLGGGYGLLGGRHGLALDNLLEARVVLADGTQTVASAEENPDLFWALRGGGGNFGIVTSARYRIHPVRRMLSGLLLFPLAQAAGVLRGYRELIAQGRDDLTVMCGFFSGPDGPLLFLLPAYSGDPAHDADIAARIRVLGTPVAGELGVLPYPDILGLSDGAVVDGRHVEAQTRWLPELTESSIEAIVSAVCTITSPFSALFLHHFHGAAARVPVSDTAFALRRDHLLVEIVAAWTPPAADGGAVHRSWARDLSDELSGAAVDGGYANLLGPDDAERVLLGYGPNAARLLALKKQFDPDILFNAVPTLPT